MRARYVLLRVTIAGIPLIELIKPPWRRYVVESRLPRELVVRMLSQSVQPGLWFRSSDAEPFEGTVATEGFKIRRAGTGGVLSSRREFVAVIVGRFEPSAYGTRIVITIRPVLAQLLFWLLAIGAVALIGVLATARALRAEPRALAVVPVVVAVLGYLYLYACVRFAFEVRKSKRPLDEILTRAPSSRDHPTP